MRLDKPANFPLRSSLFLDKLLVYCRIREIQDRSPDTLIRLNDLPTVGEVGPKLAKSGFVGLHFTGVATRPGRTLTVKRTCAFLLRGRLSDNLSVSASVARCHSPASLALPAVDPHTRPRASATSMADNAFTGARGEPDLLMSKTHEKDTLDDASSGENVHGGPRELTAAEEKILSSAYLKLDLFFLSTLTFIYWLNFLDRANIGNARAAGTLLSCLDSRLEAQC